MNKVVLIPTILIGIASFAHADEFEAIFTPFANQTPSHSADLDLFGSLSSTPGVYDITSVVGEVDGISVNSATNGYAGADNTLTISGNPSYVTFGGLSFSDANGNSWNLATDFAYAANSYSLYNNVENPNGYAPSAGYAGTEGSLTVQSVPEPFSMTLLGIGAAALLRKKRS